MNDLLRIRSLSKHYDGFDLETSTSPCRRKRRPAIGSNGAGKTTTIKAILGLIYPDAGSIELLGQNVGEHAGSKAIKDAKQRTGVVFDTCSFPEEMTVASVGKLMSYSYDSWSPADFEQRLAQFQLPKSKTVKDLSRGMSMKLSLACALAHDPDLLILDEATAGLDPLAREEALNILRGYMRDERHGILMSSHITSDLEKIADYIVCIAPAASCSPSRRTRSPIWPASRTAARPTTSASPRAASSPPASCAACATPTASTYWLPTVSRSPRTSRTSPSTRPISMSTWA
ncbi:MAG: ATP-binding cassette domain-containing protein [Eggerthella lenta]